MWVCCGKTRSSGGTFPPTELRGSPLISFIMFSFIPARTWGSLIPTEASCLQPPPPPLTLHEAQEDQRRQARHRHEQQQDAAAAAPVHGGPEQQPGSAPCAHRQQVRPVEAGGGASDVAPEGAVAVADAVRDEPAGVGGRGVSNGWGCSGTDRVRGTHEVKPSTHRFFQMFLLWTSSGKDRWGREEGAGSESSSAGNKRDENKLIGTEEQVPSSKTHRKHQKKHVKGIVQSFCSGFWSWTDEPTAEPRLKWTGSPLGCSVQSVARHRVLSF